MKYWRKLSAAAQDERITQALKDNIDYKQSLSLGIPASRLDPLVFYDQASFLSDAPLLRTYIQNPNHIGYHTSGTSEHFFKGTQELERELISLLSVDVFKAQEESCDGYVTAGGTEANIQAVWIYRNLFMKEHKATHDQIAILCSEDTHYSVAKAADLLHLSLYQAKVSPRTRVLDPEILDELVKKALSKGIRYFIIIANAGTTMFGSMDDPDTYALTMLKHKIVFKMHLDAAFGGFIYPFSIEANAINFLHPHVSSITLDAHKMLQAPYGTGIFLCKKGLMDYVHTAMASYVNGADSTLSGSRSGANAVAIWMILMTYGPHGWLEKINKLLYRTDWLCGQLMKMQIPYFRQPGMNIIAIKAAFIDKGIAQAHGLVPDDHYAPTWYKVVVMDHVEIVHLQALVADMSANIVL